MNPIVKRAWDHLKTRYAVETVLLYGSFAGGTPTDRSDVDVVAWAPVDHPCHDSSVIGGRVLDAWIYPLAPGPSSMTFPSCGAAIRQRITTDR
jgi:hypothetical protein